jgi:serine/threonine protein kinase
VASPSRRIRTIIATPAGVLVTVPALVALLGLVMTVLGRAALRVESQSAARDVLGGQATLVAQDTESALAQAEPILDRLHDVAANDEPARPIAGVAPALHDLVLAHAGVTYVSISFPDGTFRGAFLEDGAVHVQESRVGAGAEVQRWGFAGGALVPRGHEPSTYDPRTRPFYQRATASPGRTWTDPYTFYRTHLTGVTATEAVRDANGNVHAVLTVDFDVDGLSNALGRSTWEGGRTILFSQDGTILAYTAQGRAPPRPTGDALLRARDLNDPSVSALVDGSAAIAPGAPTLTTLGSGDDAELAAVATIRPPKGAPPSFAWRVAALAPERSVLGPVHVLERRALVANVVAVLVAIGVAVALARHIVRMRRDLQETKASLTNAENRARELGSYRLVARLGAGGQGEVWRAEHRLLRRAAAIKLIRSDLPPEEIGELRERFRREAQALASMRSRHTIELFDYGVSADGVFFYVMELLDGVDLDTLVAEHGPQPSARVIAILAQAAASLAEAHERSLLHRDVKPANLFLCRAADELDVVKVLDFGLVNPFRKDRRNAAADVAPELGSVAKLLTAEHVDGTAATVAARLTQGGTVLGTPGFMSPEQAVGAEEIDARTDVYALGCVAWWLLTGKFVFDLHDVNQMLVAHVIRPVPELRPLVPGWLPPELEALVLRCLAKAPGDRPDTARVVLNELRAIPVPAEEAWDDAKKIAWWEKRPRKQEVEAEHEAAVVVVSEGLSNVR